MKKIEKAILPSGDISAAAAAPGRLAAGVTGSIVPNSVVEKINSEWKESKVLENGETMLMTPYQWTPSKIDSSQKGLVNSANSPRRRKFTNSIGSVCVKKVLGQREGSHLPVRSIKTPLSGV